VNVDQPKASDEIDNVSISLLEVFDLPPPPPRSERPLLAAALKAKQEREQQGAKNTKKGQIHQGKGRSPSTAIQYPN
jgi:hypothetical protein